METVNIDNDIKIFYVTARSFPAGILEAMQKLHSLIPFSKDRKYMSVSRPENGGEIVYKAGATELEAGDLSKHDLNSLIIKKGPYYCIEIHNFRKDVTAIGRAFEELIVQKDIDPEGYCVEWYSNTSESVKCMVRIKE
ncbi:MAG: transcriptional regulator [Bacteroidia bacterium]|nr:transcriptional regulator [Bacteroidia bacterium]